MSNSKLFWINTPSFRRLANDFDVNFEALADILKDYIKTKNYELYSIRMSELFGHYESFAKQRISAELNICADEVHNVDEYNLEESVKTVILVPNKTVLYSVKEIDNETDPDIEL